MDHESGSSARALTRLLGIAITLLAVNLIALAFVIGVGPAQAKGIGAGGTSDDLALPRPNPPRSPEPAATVGHYAQPSGGYPGFLSVSIGEEFTRIQRISLPAGKYIVNAQAVLGAGFKGPSVGVQCIFTVNGFTYGEVATGTVGDESDWGHKVTLPLTAGFDFKDRTSLAVACRTGRDAVVVSQGTPITAIKLDRLIVKHGIGFDPYDP